MRHTILNYMNHDALEMQAKSCSSNCDTVKAKGKKIKACKVCGAAMEKGSDGIYACPQCS